MRILLLPLIGFWELFFKHVLQKKLKIKDYWWRYEWQFRGFSHVHAFFWLEDAPAVESLDLEDPESVAAFIEFWDPLVSTWNPSQTQPKAPDPPEILRNELHPPRSCTAPELGSTAYHMYNIVLS